MRTLKFKLLPATEEQCCATENCQSNCRWLRNSSEMFNPLKSAGNAAAGEGGVPAPPRVTVKGSENEYQLHQLFQLVSSETSPVRPSRVVDPPEKKPAPRIEAVPPTKIVVSVSVLNSS
jgi:hypothetical protein